MPGSLPAARQDGALRQLHGIAHPNPLLDVLLQAQAALGPKERPIVPLASLLRAARPGDLLLFRNKLLRSVAQRLVTTSEWDHVAIVVRRPRHRLGGGTSGGSKKEAVDVEVSLESIFAGDPAISGAVPGVNPAFDKVAMAKLGEMLTQMATVPTTTLRAAPVPAEWRAFCDPRGHTYYVNQRTGESSWTPPCV